MIIALKIAYQPPRNLETEGITINKSVLGTLKIGSNNYNCVLHEISESFARVSLVLDGVDNYNSNSNLNISNLKNIYNNDSAVFIINNTSIPCKIIFDNNSNNYNLKNSTNNNIIKLQFININYSGLDTIMDILLDNIKPYKRNLQ